MLLGGSNFNSCRDDEKNCGPLTVVGQLWPGTAAVNDQLEWWNPLIKNQAHPSAASGIENILNDTSAQSFLNPFDLIILINLLGT